MGKATAGVIYGVRLRAEFDYRYIGLTTKSEHMRLSQHFKVAGTGRKTPFYDWLRKQDRDEVIADVLDRVYDPKKLGRAEIDWIAYLRKEGQPLLNLADGGLGPVGVVWTAEMREAARVRSTGRPGVSRFGDENPFHGRTHSASQRAKWSIERKGTYEGEANPNYGKFGPEHPGFGRVMSEESRLRLSEMRTGAGNPNYGRTASGETRAKMSVAQKGRPKPTSRRNAHTRHHTNKAVFTESCAHCLDDLATRNDPESEADS
ncbi:NUMOD3 domain-containing DNA-binding protein [Nocardia salmonicida]|uniref:NUMOD3 domain-containing DNA-binding protein n=1 Tax=Nocardia salmonicida TaxID=53431 RepID=UPI003796C079